MPTPSPLTPLALSPRRSAAGFTLVELAISLSVIVLLFAGLFSALIQVRKLTEASLAENSATTIVQGYIEQLKSMNYTALWNDADGDGVNDVATVSTRLSGLTADTLTLSTAAIPEVSALNLNAASPAGIADNTRLFDINNTASTTDDVRLTLWLWVTPLDDPAADIRDCLRITVIYTRTDGSSGVRTRHVIHTIRSFVPSL